MELENILFIIEIIGAFDFSLSGAITGIQRQMDVFGVIAMGITTAAAGGIIRDVLLGHFPPRIFYSYEYLIICVVASLAVFIVAYIAKGKFSVNLDLINHIDNIFDAIGLGLFSVLGVGFGLEEGYAENAVFCIFLGTITGVGGGIFRDIMSLSVPLIFRKHIYAMASVLGSATYYFMMINDCGKVWSIIVAMLLTFLLRMLATIFKWSLPKINLYEN